MAIWWEITAPQKHDHVRPWYPLTDQLFNLHTSAIYKNQRKEPTIRSNEADGDEKQ
jgi:hypothetical protein